MKKPEKVITELDFKNDKEIIGFIADAIQLDLLHKVIETTSARKNEIAQKMDVSSSFVTQLFACDKKLSINHLAAMVHYFDLNLKIEISKKQQCRIVQFCQKEAKNELVIQIGVKPVPYHIEKTSEPQEQLQKSV
jgi:predicted transcriptional regulator